MPCRVGITIHNAVKQLGRGRHCAGLPQHALLLQRWLDQRGYATTFLASDPRPQDVDIGASNALDGVDVVVAIGLILSEAQLNYCRDKGIRTILYSLGNGYYLDVCQLLNFNAGTPIPLERHHELYDEVWILPQFAFSKDYIRFLTHPRPVRIGPYFWAPVFLECSTPLVPPHPLSERLDLGAPKTLRLQAASPHVPVSH